MKKATDTLPEPLGDFPVAQAFIPPDPVVETLQAAHKIVVTVKMTIPVMDYGTMALEATQELAEMDADPFARAEQTEDAIDLLRDALAQTVLPLVCAEVERAKPVLVKDDAPDAFMRRNCKIYQYLRLIAPDMRIPPMDAILAEREAKALPI